MVFVVLSGLSLNVDPADLAQKINTYFGTNKEIGTFHINIDDSDIRKPKAVLKFKQGFDAMEAQRLLNNFKYLDPEDNLIYKLKAHVPTNDQLYQKLFKEQASDIADNILAEKEKRKKEKRAKKRKRSPIDKTLLSDQSCLSKKSLETVGLKQLEKLCKKLRKKSERAARKSSQSEISASESELIKKDKSIYGESSGVSKRPKTPEDPILKKYKKESGEQRTGESCSTTRERSSSSTTTDSLSPRSLGSPRKNPNPYKRPHTPEDTASSKSFDSRKVNVDEKEYRRPSDGRAQYRSKNYDPKNDRRDYRYLPRSERDHRSRRSPLRVSSSREFENYYGYNRAPPRGRGEQSRRSERDVQSSNDSTDSEQIVGPQPGHAKKLLLLDPSHYLTENNIKFKEAVSHIINTVATNTERLQIEDKNLILDNFKSIVVNRLKNLKFNNLMSIQDIVLDYKLVYKTTDDKLLINNLIKELQALGKGVLLPEVKRERLDQAIDEVLENTDIDELIEDIKPEIKTENKVEYEYEDGETTEVINIVVNLVPIEKRELPFETEPDKITEIKYFVSKLKNTRPSKFFRPIRSLLNEMKLFIYNNAKIVPSEVILNRMVEVLEKILARMMGPIKTRVKAKDVCNLFRYSFPYKEDREFVDMIIKWILDGEFDKGAIDGLITEKIPNIKKPKTTEQDTEENKQNLPTTVKTEPQDTDTIQTLPIPIKKETNENRSEETVPMNIISQTLEQQRQNIEIKHEKQSNLVEIIDDDIVVKKEPVYVITIDDDNSNTKKEPDDNLNTKVKQERVNISDSEEEGALSDDSATTFVIDTKPFLDVDTTFGDTQNIDQGGPVPIVPMKSNEMDDRSRMSGEILEGSGELGEILEGPSESGEILEGPSESGEILEGPSESGEILEGPSESGETIDDIRQYLKREDN